MGGLGQNLGVIPLLGLGGFLPSPEVEIPPSLEDASGPSLDEYIDMGTAFRLSQQEFANVDEARQAALDAGFTLSKEITTYKNPSTGIEYDQEVYQSPEQVLQSFGLKSQIQRTPKIKARQREL